MVDYSEMYANLAIKYDFRVIEFPNSPSLWADRVKSAYLPSTTFGTINSKDMNSSTNEVEKSAQAQLMEQSLNMILKENVALVNKINLVEVVPLIDYIHQAERIFIIATGRSGFAMRSAAMRLMHLGFTVYFVGETTTPAIGPKDLLITASGSGNTSSIVSAAQKAVLLGANVVAITTDAQSNLAALANQVILIPAAGKQEHTGEKSVQYSGGLFEQFLLLLMDSVFHTLWQMDGSPAEELWKRHANLE